MEILLLRTLMKTEIVPPSRCFIQVEPASFPIKIERLGGKERLKKKNEDQEITFQLGFELGS